MLFPVHPMPLTKASKLAVLLPLLKCLTSVAMYINFWAWLQGDITGAIKDLTSDDLRIYGNILGGIAKFIPGYTQWSDRCNGFICSVATPPDTTCGAAALQQMRASFCGVGTWTLFRPCIIRIMLRPECCAMRRPGIFLPVRANLLLEKHHLDFAPAVCSLQHESDSILGVSTRCQ